MAFQIAKNFKKSQKNKGSLLEIKRVPIDIPFHVFNSSYFQNDTPVILVHTASDWKATKKWSFEYLLQELKKSGDLDKVGSVCFEPNDEFLKEDYIFPDLVKQIQEHHQCFTRSTSLRIWLNKKNHVTPLHYDSSYKFGFNVQIKGNKRWTIVSPETPPPFLPFTRFSIADSDTLHGVIQYNFTLCAGEMLFIPPLWCHRVVSIDEENINLNFVATKTENNENPAFIRENELMKLAIQLSKSPTIYNLVNGLHQKLFGEELEIGEMIREYSQVEGTKMANNFSHSVSTWTLVRRVLYELAHLYLVPNNMHLIKSYDTHPLRTMIKSLN